MRQAERAALQGPRVYKFALLRIRMPGAIMLQGTFHATDSTAALYRMARESLLDETISFQLVTHPERTLIEDSPEVTLKDKGLVPTAIVNFSCPSHPHAALKPFFRNEARPFE
jgi:hypothetical protein